MRMRFVLLVAALAGVDLVVEAVFEDPKVKAETTVRAEAVLPETTSQTKATTSSPSQAAMSCEAGPMKSRICSW